MSRSLLLVLCAASAQAFAASSDPCAAKALSAAEAAYGNDPVRTSVKAVVAGAKYRVRVGIGNAEDGPVDYDVAFAHGCSSRPSVAEVGFVPHPLRGAVHAVYGKLLA